MVPPMTEGTENESEKDMVLLEGSSNTMLIAVGSVLAAVYAILALLPLSTFIGGGGSILSFSIIMAPLFGIFLGPVRGFVFGAISGVLATLVLLPFGGGVYLIIPTTILGPAMAGLFVGLARSNEKLGPLITALYLLLVTFLYEIVNYAVWWFMTPYMFAAGIALFLQVKQIEFDPAREGLSKYIQLLPLVIIGAMADHSMMAMGSVYLLELPADLFAVIFPLMLLERIVVIIAAAIVGAIVLTAFKDVTWMNSSDRAQ